ncbi:MAG: CbiX/SirB N-terminal domain-containing protein [Pseudomonadota bacterium]
MFLLGFTWVGLGHTGKRSYREPKWRTLVNQLRPYSHMLHADHLLVLLAHGSRQPEWARPFEVVHQAVLAARPSLVVRLAFLESMQPSLRQVLEDAGQDGCVQVSVVPMFLGAGGHLQRDIPQIAREAQERFPTLRIDIAQPAGDDAEVLAALAAYALRCATGLDA